MKRIRLILILALFGILAFGVVSCSKDGGGEIPKIWQILLYVLGVSFLIGTYIFISQWLKIFLGKIDKLLFGKLDRKIDRTVERMFSKEDASKQRKTTAIKNEKETRQPLNPVEPKCQHDWFCGKCRTCGETEKYTSMYGHDVVCGKCIRCGKIPFMEYEKIKSHKRVQCKCTVCGLEMHNWKLVRLSSSQGEYQCVECGKENVAVYEVDDAKYYGGSRDD